MKKFLSLFLFLISGFIKLAVADVTGPSGRFIQIRQDLQPSSTFYVSSGTFQSYIAANGIMSLPHSATPPPTDCDTDDERGRVYIDTDSVSGRQFYACEGTLGWILQGDGGSGGGSGTTILVKDGGSSIVNTSTLNFTGATFVVTNSGGEGLVAIDFSSVPSRSDVILNQNSLQSGATFFVSSGSVSGQLSVTQIKFPDGTIQVSSPTAGAGSSPGGSNTNVQFNDGGAFGGSSKFSFDKSSATIILLNDYKASNDLDAITILSSSTYANSPTANASWQFRDAVGSTQTVFQISAAQSSADTSTSTLVSFKVRGDNQLDTVLRIGEPSGSTVPYVEFPTTGTRLNFVGTGAAAYIENNPTSLDLTIVPTTSANRLRIGSGSTSNVALLFDGSSNDGNVEWDSANDVFEYSDDIQMQAQNQVRFADSDSSNYVGFQGAASIGSNVTWTLPSADGTSGQAITTNGSGTLSFTTIAGGGGGASALEVFSNFDGTRSSPTASISLSDQMKLTVTGSTAVISVDPANVILSTNGLQAGTTFFVSSGTVANNLTVGSTATISGWSISGIDNDYVLINPRSSGINLKIDRSNAEIRMGNAASASPAVLTFQNSAGLGTLAYTGPTNGYASNSHIGLSSGKALRLYDTIDSNYVALKASSTLSATNTYVLPASSGTAGQAILTDGRNNLYFGTISGGGGGGTTIRVENQGSFAVNSSTFNFDRGLLAIDDVGEAKIQLDPSTYVGSQSWSDGASDTTIDVTYNISVGTPPQWSYTDDNISTLNDLALPDLTANQPLKLNGSQVITSAPINLADTTNEVTGILPGAKLGSGSTNYIQNTGTLQSNATFYVSSGTATNFTSSNLTASNITATNITGTNILVTNLLANFGAAYRVPYLSGANLFTTDANFFYADFAQILYGPSILGTVQMGAYNGASVVAYDNDSSNFVGLKSSAAITSNNTYVLPASSGTAGQVIQTDGANNLSFVSVAPLSGATTYIQNTNSLQTGATFYVSSGTVQGQFNVFPSSNGRTNYLNFNTTFVDDFFDSKYLNQRAYIPNNDGSYGGLGYKLIASTNVTSASVNEDPTLTLSLSAAANGASMSVGNSYFQVLGAGFAAATFTNGTDIVGMDNTNGTYVNASSFTVYGTATPGQIRIRDNDGGAHYAILKASNSMSSDITMILPSVAGTANQVLSSDGSNNLAFKEVRRAMKFSEVFNAEQAKVPGSNPCVISNSTAATIPSLLCDASTDESASWSTILTEYTTTTMRANIYYTMVSTNSGAVVHNIQVMCASTTYSADLDTESFGSVNASTITVPSSIGRVGVATVTVTAGDSCGSNDLLVLKYTRDANASADTATGDIEIRKIWLFEP